MGARLTALAALAVVGMLLWGMAAHAQADGQVLVADVDGTISPVMADHVTAVLDEAAADDAALVVLRMDTPGGLDTSMRQIVQDVLASPIPVAVLVSPPGSRAASAGSVIALAAHVVAMTPGTTIGAATPIDLQQGQVLDKVVNDAAAYVRALAELRGRDVAFYVDTVTEGRSASASEALDQGAIDLVVDDLDQLLVELQGRQVDVLGRGRLVLDVADAQVRTIDMPLLRDLLQRLADPNLAFALLALGTLAVIWEVANSGGGFAGATGAVMLVMGFFALSVLPVNTAALLLFVLAAALFVAEAFVPGIGAFAAGGTLALAVSGLLLFERPSGVGVSIGLLLGVALLAGVASLWIGYAAVTARSAPPTIGAAGTLVGAVGVVKEAEGMAGQVLVEGARWQAISTTPLLPGMHVRVVALEGLTAHVQPTAETRSPEVVK